MDYFANIERWLQLKTTIAHLTAEEKALREGLFHGTFPNPVEGTNTYELPGGHKIKGIYKINRTVDQEAVLTIPKTLLTNTFKVKRELNIKAYRELTDKERKAIDAVLKIEPGLPGLEFVPAPTPEVIP
jgi:hypothetical protein